MSSVAAGGALTLALAHPGCRDRRRVGIAPVRDVRHEEPMRELLTEAKRTNALLEEAKTRGAGHS